MNLLVNISRGCVFVFGGRSIGTYILLKNKKGKIKCVYCCIFDSVLNFCRILTFFYKDYRKVSNLFECGDLYKLGERIFPDDSIIHNFSYPQDNVCLFYERDLNIRSLKKEFDDFDDFLQIVDDYSYIFIYVETKSKWYVYNCRFSKIIDTCDILSYYNKNELNDISYKIRRLANKYINIEKKYNSYLFNKTYESTQDAFYELVNLLQDEYGFENMIDVLNNRLLEKLTFFERYSVLNLLKKMKKALKYGQNR